MKKDLGIKIFFIVLLLFSIYLIVTGIFTPGETTAFNNNGEIFSNVVKEKIDTASKDILDGKFDINPKVIKNVNKGCMYCKYRDICYMKNEDIVNLEEKKLFGGEDDE